MSSDGIRQVEGYVKQSMAGEDAHDYQHVDRVRNWALKIAVSEGYDRPDLVQAAALLHDIGRANGQDKDHARVGAEMAARFLRETALFTSPEAAEIVHAVRYHNSVDEQKGLARIVKDADILDLLGAVGIMRAIVSMHALPEYDPRDVKGNTWGLSNAEFNMRMSLGTGVGDRIVDYINFQLSCYRNLQTATAKQIAQPLAEYMTEFLVQLEVEIVAGRSARGEQPPATQRWW